MALSIPNFLAKEKVVGVTGATRRLSFDYMRILSLGLAAFICAASSALAAEPVPTKWAIDGVEREALVYLPSTSSKSKPPVIFAFHGHGGNMHFAARGMAFQNYWPEAVVVYPQGLPTPGIVMDFEGKKPGWQNRPGQQGNRDVKFVDAILASLREKYSVDDNRIYATGFSNGGLFSYLLLSQRPKAFAAFAPGGAVLLPQLWLTQARPVFHYGGESDRLARFGKQEATIERLWQFNGCAPQGESCGSNCTIYNSSKGAPVETFIHSGGHFIRQALLR